MKSGLKVLILWRAANQNSILLDWVSPVALLFRFTCDCRGGDAMLSLSGPSPSGSAIPAATPVLLVGGGLKHVFWRPPARGSQAGGARAAPSL